MGKTKINPLAHLAWLGILGVIGLFFAPIWIVFLLFFFFLAYRKMPADELFWSNLRRAATLAFAVNIGYNIVALISIAARGAYYTQLFGVQDLVQWMDNIKQEPMLLNPAISEYMFSQFGLITAFFSYGIIISLCVFFFSLIRINRKEKKFLEDTAATTIDMAVTADDNN